MAPEPSGRDEQMRLATSHDEERTIAENIRRLRKQRNITLQLLASRTGLTKGYLSKIERSEKAPPYSTLNKIAGALGIEVTDFFKKDFGPGEDRQIVFVPSKEGRIIRESTHYAGYDYMVLAAGKPGKNMEPFFIFVPFEFPGLFKHEGEEFFYVLEGKIEFKYGEKTIIMAEGDHTYFDSCVPHTGRSIGDKRAKLLVVIYFYKRNRQ